MIEIDGVNKKNINFSEAINSDHFEKSPMFSLIQVPVLLDRIAFRQSITRNIALIPGAEVLNPLFKLLKAEDFRIVKMNELSNINLYGNSKLKKLDLIINLEYNLLFTDGINRIKQPDIAIFNLTLNGINYPDNKVKYFENDYAKESINLNNENKLKIQVDVLAEAFGDVICPNTGALILEIGAFFIINLKYKTELYIPGYQLYDF